MLTKNAFYVSKKDSIKILTFYLECLLQLFWSLHANCKVLFPSFFYELNKKYLLSVKTTATEKLKKYLTSAFNDSHLDLTFPWPEPKQFKRLKNRLIPILLNWEKKYLVKIQRATCTVFFNSSTECAYVRWVTIVMFLTRHARTHARARTCASEGICLRTKVNDFVVKPVGPFLLITCSSEKKKYLQILTLQWNPALRTLA